MGLGEFSMWVLVFYVRGSWDIVPRVIKEVTIVIVIHDPKSSTDNLTY